MLLLQKDARQGAGGRHIFMLPEEGNSEREEAVNNVTTAV